MTQGISTRLVPNIGPSDARIAFVGEAPGAEEDKQGEPFVGESGNKLTNCLGRNGIERSEVWLGNCLNYRPPLNKFIDALSSPEMAESLERLYEDLRKLKPTLIVPLGAWPLFFITGRTGKKPGTGILNWRGSILQCKVPGLEGIKCIPTVHPAAVLRDASLYPIFDQDIKRIVQDSKFPELRLPERRLVIAKDPDEQEYWTSELLKADLVSVDIETFGPRLACVGFAPEPKLGVCFVASPTVSFNDCVSRLLESRARKVFHFGTFDTEFLALQGFKVNNYWWDTLVAQHVMYTELPRALKYLTSVYTREPYYKDEAKEDLGADTKSWGPRVNKDHLWNYNCKDVCVTIEIQGEQEKELAEGPEGWRTFFSFEMEELEIASHISRTGMLRDEERRKLLEKALVLEYQERQSGLVMASNCNINVNSPKQVKTLLYEMLKLPVRRNRKGGVTSDVDALVSLLAFCMDKANGSVKATTIAEWKRKALVVKLIMLVRQTRKTLSSYILTKASPDGRVRSIYKVAATDTGRWSAEKFVDDTGLNSQTIPREPLEVPDDFFGQDSTSVTVPAEVLSSEDDAGADDDSDSDSNGDVLGDTQPIESQ